jgi:CubicO group peptidase (beta-lactamase class C family)
MRLATRSRASAARLTLAAARLVVLVATAARLDAQGPAPAADSAARAARVERSLVPLVRVRGRSYPPATIEERMRALGVPAVSVAVVDSGRVAWARAYGLADVGAGRRATPATLFQAASMSKPVAAFAALRLVAAGRLALDDDVNARLTSWRVPASAAAGGQAGHPAPAHDAHRRAHRPRLPRLRRRQCGAHDRAGARRRAAGEHGRRCGSTCRPAASGATREAGSPSCSSS